MSACLKGHFYAEFASTTKILLLTGKSKLSPYMPCSLSLSVHLCVCAIFMGLDIPMNTASLFSASENQCYLGIYKDKSTARLLSRWKCLTNFCIHWRHPHRGISPRDFNHSFICTRGNGLFSYETLTDATLKPRGCISLPCLWHSRVGADGHNSDGKIGKSSGFLPGMYGKTFNMGILQTEGVPFARVLSKVKINRLPQGQHRGGSEFSSGTPGRLSQALEGMSSRCQWKLGAAPAFLQGGKERGGQTPHPPCLSSASKSPSLILMNVTSSSVFLALWFYSSPLPTSSGGSKSLFNVSLGWRCRWGEHTLLKPLQ